MTTLLALIRKDLLIFFQDRRAVIMSFVAPILIGSFFGYVFGGQSRSGEQGKVTVIAVDQQQGTVSKQIIAKLRAEPVLAIQEAGIDEATDLVRKGKASVAIVIPRDFGRKATQALFRSTDRPVITFLMDPSRQMEAKMIQGMLTGLVMQVVSKEAFSGELGKANLHESLQALNASTGIPEGEKADLKLFLQSVERYSARPQSSSTGVGSGVMGVPFNAVEKPVTARTGEVYNPYAHSFGGMAVQFILFFGIDVGIGMLLAWTVSVGLWKRFAASPLSKWTLLGGRVLSATLIVTAILVVVFAFARLVFGVKIQGSLIGFALVCISFGLMTASYGLLIASIGKTPQGARDCLSGSWRFRHAAYGDVERCLDSLSFLFPKCATGRSKICTRALGDGWSGRHDLARLRA